MLVQLENNCMVCVSVCDYLSIQTYKPYNKVHIFTIRQIIYNSLELLFSDCKKRISFSHDSNLNESWKEKSYFDIN